MLTRLLRCIICIVIIPAIFSCKKENTNIPKTLVYEVHRPMYHFTPDSMWMNDPNGLVYYDGEYHLFYQYYPDSTVWGPMHWGHAISKDMIDWQDLPIALYPDSIGYIFSGSAVIDWQNTSGFGMNGQPPMVAIFTYHNMDAEKAGSLDVQKQGIAFSNDKGRTWTKYNNNPVIKNPGLKDFRDPKVIWYEAGKHWVMVLAARDRVKFYTSTNLKSWTYASDFGIDKDPRLWECPDIFPMEVDGSDEMKWVLITSMQTGAPNGGTGTSYWVGDFDGKGFKCADAKSNQQWLDDGKDNYAFVTWSDIPATDGRRMGIGWMSNWQYAQIVPSQKWRSAMTLPRTLALQKYDAKYLLTSHPVSEIKNIKDTSQPISTSTIKGSLVLPVNTTLYNLALDFKKPNGTINIVCYNDQNDSIVVGYDAYKHKYFIDRSHTGIADFSKDFAGKHYSGTTYDSDTIQMQIYIDHASIELFAEKGRCAMTDIFFTKQPLDKVKIVSGEEAIKMYKGVFTPMHTITKRK